MVRVGNYKEYFLFDLIFYLDSLMSFLLWVEFVCGQLVGHRGVVDLPQGWVYHDNITLDASRAAAR